MKRFNVTAVLTANFVVEAESKEEARKIAFDMPAETEWELTNDNIPTRIYFEIADVPSVTNIDLIDKTNNHDEQLVECINKAWYDKREDFIKIVDFLIERDINEIEDRDNFEKSSYFERCRVYCQHIADNKDLDTILCYCRM